MERSALDELARRQHGLVTRDQALACGVSPTGWLRQVASNRLFLVHDGVARLAGTVPTPEQTILAAVFAAGPGAMASHRSAAFLWGLDVPPCAPVDIVVPRERRVELDAVRVHRPRDRDDLRSATRRAVPVCRPLRVLLDLGMVTTPSVVCDALESFLVRGLVSVDAVHRALERHRIQGRPGLAPLALVLDEWPLGDAPPDSTLEVAMARLLRRAGLPPAAFHPRLVIARRRFVPDFAYVDERLAIEVDGWQYHGTRRAFEADRERDATFAAAGWVVARFTWSQVVRRGAQVAARLRSILDARMAA